MAEPCNGSQASVSAWPKQITLVNLMLISEEVCASPMKGLQVTWKCVGYIIFLQEM